MLSIKEQNGDRVQNARMLVFLPGILENVGGFSQQIYNQAAAREREVLYLAVASRGSDQYAAARQLTIITALTQGNSVHAAGKQIELGNWTEMLRQITQPGDLLIWPEERWLAPADLERELGITQRVLTGVQFSEPPHESSWYRPVLFWLAVLVLLVGFSFLEINLQDLIGGTPLKAGLIILFALMCGALVQLDRIFH